MPVKKSGKQKAAGSKRKVKVAGARKTAAKAAKKVGAVAKKVGESAKAAVSNPRRTVRKAADNAHATVGRARSIGDSVVAAGEIIKGTADLVDSIAQRAKKSTKARSVAKKKSR
ncbi:MAG TPA: hypothetical protein VKR56_15160 [Candidatus Cybelea sp.]|nr:hypothetical protein [Candidatus Cybelea sp.]